MTEQWLHGVASLFLHLQISPGNVQASHHSPKPSSTICAFKISISDKVSFGVNVISQNLPVLASDKLTVVCVVYVCNIFLLLSDDVMCCVRNFMV